MRQHWRVGFETLVALLVGCAALLVGVPPAIAAPQDVVISEVMYDPRGTDNRHEWVELANLGSEEVTIVTGSGAGSWRFFDGSNHLFTLFQGSETIPAGGYVVLADDPETFLVDYPSFSGTLFKVSLSLNNDGDTLRISLDRGVSYFGEVIYTRSQGGAGNGRTLERDGEVFRESYVDGGTPGAPASTPPPGGPPPVPPPPAPPNPPAPPPPPSPPSSRQPTGPPSTQVYSDAIVINEVYPNPKTGDEEFVEFFNTSQQSVDLTGWKLDDRPNGGSRPHTIAAGTTIAAGGYLALFKKITLNNNEDSVQLLDPNNVQKSNMNYTSTTKGRSWARKTDGSFVLTRIVTPGQPNQFPQPEQSRDIVINELVPDPGSGQQEAIELRNTGSKVIDLTDWQLDDGEGGSRPYTIPEGTTIPANGYAVFESSVTKLNLNNTGDSVRLFWAEGTKVGEVVYTKAKKNQSYSRRDDGSFNWTPSITLGAANEFPSSGQETASQVDSDTEPEVESVTAPIRSSPETEEPATVPRRRQAASNASSSSPRGRVLGAATKRGTSPSRLRKPFLIGTLGSLAVLGALGGFHQWYIRRKLKSRPMSSASNSLDD